MLAPYLCTVAVRSASAKGCERKHIQRVSCAAEGGRRFAEQCELFLLLALLIVITADAGSRSFRCRCTARIHASQLQIGSVPCTWAPRGITEFFEECHILCTRAIGPDSPYRFQNVPAPTQDEGL